MIFEGDGSSCKKNYKRDLLKKNFRFVNITKKISLLISNKRHDKLSMQQCFFSLKTTVRRI